MKIFGNGLADEFMNRWSVIVALFFLSGDRNLPEAVSVGVVVGIETTNDEPMVFRVL